MTADLDIISVSARTPIGHTAEATAAAVRGGVARLQEYSYVDPEGEPIIVASDSELTDDVGCRARAELLAERAAAELADKLGRLAEAEVPVDLRVVVPQSRPGFDDDDAKAVARRALTKLHEADLKATVRIAGRGHAGVLEAVRSVSTGGLQSPDAATVVLGVDSYLDLDTLAWLETQRRLSQSMVRSGFVPGEAAAAFAIVPRALRRALQLPALAQLHGVGLATESLLRDSDSGSLGVATTQAVRIAASGLNLPGDAADAVYCDLNGERYRSEDWGFFALRGAAFVKTPQYVAPADCWGDVGAAFGALGIVLATQSFVRGYAPGPVALVMTASDAGQRGAAFLRAAVPGR